MSDPVLIALILAVPPTLTAAGSVYVSLKVKKDISNLHKEVNGRMTELILSTKEAASAVGRAEGAASERASKL